jgi:hypothetical protein
MILQHFLGKEKVSVSSVWQRFQQPLTASANRSLSIGIRFSQHLAEQSLHFLLWEREYRAVRPCDVIGHVMIG